MKTQAIVFSAANEIELRELEVPAVGPGDVRVRTSHSFVSTGTERWTWEGQMGKRAYDGGVPFPIVPGYQQVGIVEEVGKDVTSVSVGQRVFMIGSRVEGASSCWGGHMQVTVQDEGQVYALPDELPSEVAAGLVVIQVGWNTGHRPTLKADNALAVVIGDGIIGQFTAQALKSRGAEVWIAGRHEFRLDMARKWTATRTVNTNEEDLLEAIKAARPGGADIVIETISRPEKTPWYIQMTAVRGQFVIAGYHPDTNMVDMARVQDKEITCHSTGGMTRPRMEATIKDIVDGTLNPAALITHRIPWNEAPAAYERLVRDKAEDSLGIVIEWERA